MRSLASLVVVSSLLAPPLRARADGQSAASLLDTAQHLAARGHCDEALRLRPLIERLDPDLARMQFASDPAIAACLAGTAPPPAPVVEPRAEKEPPDVSAPPAPAPPTCGPLGGYFEPSIFAAAGSPGFGVLGRAALGFRLYQCDDAGHENFAVRIGGTFSLRAGRLGFGPPSGAGGGGLYAAGGGEIEATAPIAGHRIGLRAGIEGYYGRMTTVGLRLRDGSGVYAIDGFYSQSTDFTSLPRTSDAGLMLGVSYDAHVGLAGFLGALGLAALVAFIGLSAAAGGN